MLKTRLGISVGLFGAAIFLACLFGGILPAILLTGYVLLFEENEWLKKSAVKATALLLVFYLLSELISLLPGAINMIDSFVSIFNGHVQISFITNLAHALNSIVSFVKTIVFIILGLKALTQGTITIPVVDKLINKYMG